ncbi:MAG: GTPase, partial [Alphaproteobacteria bacterium]
AIVAETAGTTRDVVEVHLDLGGFPVIVADTAGLREAADGVESEGIRRAEARAAEADIKLALFDITLWPELDAKTLALVGDDTVPILNKADLLGPGQGPGAKERLGGRPVVIASERSGAGMAELLKCLESMVSHGIDLAGSPALTRARHRDALEESVDALSRFAGASEAALAAEDLRLAARALGRITGRVEVDDILDVIFRDFCIGK